MTAGDSQVWVHGNVTEHFEQAAQGATRRGQSRDHAKMAILVASLSAAFAGSVMLGIRNRHYRRIAASREAAE